MNDPVAPPQPPCWAPSAQQGLTAMNKPAFGMTTPSSPTNRDEEGVNNVLGRCFERAVQNYKISCEICQQLGINNSPIAEPATMNLRSTLYSIENLLNATADNLNYIFRHFNG
jgi:hypothetical protein